MQNYNSVLTLSHLYRLSDAILVHENDTVHQICGQLLNIKNISFGDVNRVMAQQIGGVLQPALTADSCGLYSRNPLGESPTGFLMVFGLTLFHLLTCSCRPVALQVSS